MTRHEGDAPAVDRRVARSRRLLRSALMELVQEKEYARITVQDILDRADVGRSTFYAHFRDKDDLLVGDLQFILPLFDDDGPEVVPPFLPLFEHVQAFYPTLRKLIAGGAQPMMFERIRAGLVSRWHERIVRLQAGGLVRDLDPDAAAHFATAGFIALLTWWLNSGLQLSPREMDDFLRQALSEGLRGR